MDDAYNHVGWLQDTTNRMVCCRSVAALLELAYSSIHDDLGYDRVGLDLIDFRTRLLREHIGTDAMGHKFYPVDRATSIDDESHQMELLRRTAMQPGGPGFLYFVNASASTPLEDHHLLDGAPTQSLLVALRSADRVVGALSVDNFVSGRPLLATDAPPLVAFANALAAAVENITLLEEREQRIDSLDTDLRLRVAQLTWLEGAARILGAVHEIDDVLDTISTCVREGFGYDRLGIFLIERDASGRLLEHEVRGVDAWGQPIVPGEAVDLPVEEEDLGVHSPDLFHLLQGHAYYYSPDRWASTPEENRASLDGEMREQLVVGLRHDDALIGFISVDNLFSGRPITAADAPPLVAFAAQAALAISRANLWAAHENKSRALARRVGDLEWLREISHKVTTARTLDGVLDVVYDGIRGGLGYDRVGIVLFDHVAGTVEERRGTDMDGQKTYISERVMSLAPDGEAWQLPDMAAVLHGEEFYFTPDAYADTPPEQRYLLDGMPRENLSVALRTGEVCTGMISVDNLLSGRPISAADAPALIALANLVGPTIENARLNDGERVERARLEWLATTDQLTGLPNRGLFGDRLTQALLAAERQGHQTGLLLLDCDHFKQINDAHGHHIGDLVLQQVAARLRDAVRASDTVARLGGDEFAVLLPIVASIDDAIHTVQRMRERLERPLTVDSIVVNTQASIGVAFYPDHAADGATLLRCADAAMYQAKGGRTGYMVYALSRPPQVSAAPLASREHARD